MSGFSIKLSINVNTNGTLISTESCFCEVNGLPAIHRCQQIKLKINKCNKIMLMYDSRKLNNHELKI